MFFDTSDLRTSEIYLKCTEKIPSSKKGWVPYYTFSICRTTDDEKVCHCNLRIGHNERLYFGGNIGYTVHEEFRGNHYAGKACLLLLSLARKHNMEYLYITCSPDNYASKKTCEYAGAALEAVVDLPMDNDMYLDGERQKCVYRIEL